MVRPFWWDQMNLCIEQMVLKSSKSSSQLTDGGAVGGAALLDEPFDFPFLSFLVHNYFRNKSIIVEKYWLHAVRIQNPAGLRRWNYLPHPSSLSPLWISWAENEGAEGRIGVLYLRREPAAPLPPGRGAAGSLQGPLRKKNLFLFTYRSLPPGRWGYRTVKPKSKNIFL